MSLEDMFCTDRHGDDCFADWLLQKVYPVRSPLLSKLRFSFEVLDGYSQNFIDRQITHFRDGGERE